MNWRKIDDCWKEFASSKGLELHISEDHFIYGTRTKYQLLLSQSKPQLMLTGDMKKSTSGHNQYRTDLIISDIDISKLSFSEVKDKRILGLFKTNYKDQKQSDLLRHLRDHKSQWIKVYENRLEIRFEWIFDQLSDFQNALLLADKIIKTLKNNQ